MDAPVARSGDAAWWRAVMVFNLSPAAYADPSWMPLAPAPMSRAQRRQQSEALLAEHGLSANFLWDPRGLVARLMLLGVAEGAGLALSAGVMAHRARLRQVVQRERLQQWRALLGERFDLLWSPLAERVPAAPAQPACAQPGPQAAAALREDGQAVLLGLLDPDDALQRPLWQRARLRLPRSRALDAQAWQPRLSRPQAEALAEGLASLLAPPDASASSSTSPSCWSSPWTWLS